MGDTAATKQSNKDNADMVKQVSDQIPYRRSWFAIVLQSNIAHEAAFLGKPLQAVKTALFEDDPTYVEIDDCEPSPRPSYKSIPDESVSSVKSPATKKRARPDDTDTVETLVKVLLTSKVDSTKSERERKMKEMELRERELAIREKEADNKRLELELHASVASGRTSEFKWLSNGSDCVVITDDWKTRQVVTVFTIISKFRRWWLC